MLDGPVVASVSEREMLFRQGDHGRSVLVLISSFVKLSLLVTKREVVLETCGADSTFGALAVAKDWVTSADTEALSIDGFAS